MVHLKIDWEASAPKEIKTKQKSTRKGRLNKKKSANGKSNLKWLEISDILEWTWVG